MKVIPSFLLSAAALFSQGLQPLPLSLPKPLFEGTPENLRVPNLEKPLGRPRPPFLAPAGTSNLALEKSVSSSDPDPSTGDLEFVTDGQKAGTDGTFVELKPGRQHVTIDLEAPSAIYAVVVWHYLKQPRVYNDVIVQVADDPDFLTNVRTIYNNDHDNTSGFGVGANMAYVDTAEGRLIDGRGEVARYVRLYSNGSTAGAANHYVEVEVYGRPKR